MTREHKLALIVGFALVLVLGVLISDHFSKARQVEMAGANEISPPSARQVGASTNGARLVGEGTPGGQAAVTSRGDLVELPGFPGAKPLPSSGNGTSITIASDTGRPSDPAALVNVRKDPIPLPYGESHPAGPADPGAQQPPAPTPAAQIPLTRYDVKDGDTLYAIASKVYGQGSLWEKIRDYNKEKLGSNGTIHKGVTLLLPPKDVLLGKPYTPPATTTATSFQAPGTLRMGEPAGTSAQTQAGSAGTAKPVGDFKEYVVKEGDTLTAIARKQLNNPRRINDIIEANKGTLSDPESLTVGMKLRIPAK